jgi:rhodanese-related sulfurtransferase
MRQCLDQSPSLCSLFQVDDALLSGDDIRYIDASRAALLALQPPPQRAYAHEGDDWLVAEQDSLRTTAQGLESRTPMSVPGAATVDTREAAFWLRDYAAVPIYAAGWTTEVPECLPGTLLIDWIAWAAADRPDIDGFTDAALLQRLREVMTTLVPDKSTPLVVYCDGPECWDSYNAVLRLSALGYEKLYWYRGGLPAWREAGLPLVKAVFHATIFTAIERRGDHPDR